MPAPRSRCRCRVGVAGADHRGTPRPPMRMDMNEAILPPQALVAASHCEAADYDRLYQRSLDDPDGFWRDQAQRIGWIRPPSRIADWSFDPVEIKWYEDGILNLCWNC